MGFSLYLDPREVWAESLPVGGLLARIRLTGLVIQTFQITVEVFMGSNSQKFDAAYIKNPIREQP